MLFLLLIVVSMVAINALYVSAEFAAVSVRRSHIQQLASDGHSLAKQLLPILEDGKLLDRFVATCQIGITISSLVLGAFGQAALSKELHFYLQQNSPFTEETSFTVATMVVLAVLTGFQMIFGELIPKSISLRYSSKVALFTFLPMRWSMLVFSWFIAFLNGSGVFFLGLAGIKQSAHRHIHSAQELEFLIAESRDGGALEADEHARLKKALSLGSRKVSELMVPRPRMVALSLSDSIEKVSHTVAASPYTRFPVYSGSTDNVIGILHTKDFVTHMLHGSRKSQLKDLLRPLPSIPGTATADRLLALLKKRKAHMAIVIDEFGSVDGIVTLEDVLGEMMGSIGDEFKVRKHQAEQLVDGRLRLPGT